MNDDIINLESRLVFRDVSKLTAGGMSTAAALAHAAHEAAERKAKMTTGFAQDDYIRSLEEQIATLQSELAAARAELARMESSIRWALGETKFRQRCSGEGQFWWRTELRERSGIKYVPRPSESIAHKSEEG
jgi:hypothetical protein